MNDFNGNPMIIGSNDQSIKHLNCEHYDRCLTITANCDSGMRYWSCGYCRLCPVDTWVARHGERPRQPMRPISYTCSECGREFWSLSSLRKNARCQRCKGSRSEGRCYPRADKIRIPAVLIEKARKKAGITQKQLAKRIGCDAPVISNWECGKRNVGKRYEFLVVEFIRENLGNAV